MRKFSVNTLTKEPSRDDTNQHFTQAYLVGTKTIQLTKLALRHHTTKVLITPSCLGPL